MPVFNGAKTLRESLDSIAHCNDSEVEVILVDQGSNDGSIEIAETFHDRISIQIEHAPDNRSWMQNVNKALQLARAPYSTMLHQDDVWLANRMQLARAQIAEQSVSRLWVSPAQFIDEQSKTLGKFAPPFGKEQRLVDRDSALKTLLVQNTVSLPSAIFHTSTVKQIGGLDEELWYTADWDLWLKLCALSGVGWHPTPSCGFRIHGASLTARGSQNLAGFRTQLERPLERHIAQLPEDDRTITRAMAELSTEVNISLAARFHGAKSNYWRLLGLILKVGPKHWLSFLTVSQILQRSIPRIRKLRL